MKNWKSLFIKTDETDHSVKGQAMPNYSFPATLPEEGKTVSNTNSPKPINQEVLDEVIAAYEKGIDSINMPGYDFYEFYKAISSVSAPAEQVYAMAFQMARSMDSNLSAQKLLSDAEFYISKINEVHNQYTIQGQQKLNALEAKRNEEKNRLLMEIEQATQQVNQLRSQLQALENEINQKRMKLTSAESNYSPQENSVKEKLMANDNARQISISKLLAVKEGIQHYIK